MLCPAWLEWKEPCTRGKLSLLCYHPAGPSSGVYSLLDLLGRQWTMTGGSTQLASEMGVKVAKFVQIQAFILQLSKEQWCVLSAGSVPVLSPARVSEEMQCPPKSSYPWGALREGCA